MDSSTSERLRVYVGTYTRREPHVDGKSTGVHVLSFDTTTVSLSPRYVISGIVNPSFLALHPRGSALYVISEVAEHEGRAEGGVLAYALDGDEATLLNRRPTKGPGPAYVTVDAEGRNILVANYGGGSVSVLPIHADLSLAGASAFVQHEGSSVNPQRQEAPHAHCVVLDRTNRHALAADLGTDKVMIYRYSAEDGSLATNSAQPWARTKSGSGPRHIAFHPLQHYVYVITELDSTIVAYRYDEEKGAMTEIQTVSTLPDDYVDRNYGADIHVHPSGRWVYGSNRGHDSIAVFSVDAESGDLALVQTVPSGGEWPRGFALDPSGGYALVANQNSDNIVVFSVDTESGELTPTGVEVEVPTPVCIKTCA